MAKIELKNLLDAAAKGDHEAFRELYEATSGQLFGVAVRILKRSDLAEEAVQDTYLKIWNGGGGYRPGHGSPLGWMVTITRNRSIDMLRKRGEAQLGADTDEIFEDDTLPDPFTATARSRDLNALLECLKKLDQVSQKCLLLAYYYGYTHDEIAAGVSSPVGTVKSKIRRGLTRLRKCLSDG